MRQPLYPPSGPGAVRRAAVGVLTAVLTLPAIAATWDGGGDGTRWLDPMNWSPDGLPASNAIAEILLDETTVVLDGTASVMRVILTDEASDNVTLIITNGGRLVLNDVNGADMAVAGSTAVMEVLDGGELDGGSGGSTLRGNVDLLQRGGTIRNLHRLRFATDILVTGGRFIAGRGIEETMVLSETGTRLVVTNDAVIAFTAFADDAVIDIRPNTGTEFNLADARVEVRIADGYVPQSGDAFDFIGAGGTVTLRDGSEIATVSADGRFLLEWDRSQWNPNGSPKGQLTLTNVQALILTNLPPDLVLAPTGTAVAATVGNPLAINVTATQTSNDLADIISLDATGLPAGADFPPTNGLSPLAQTFTWTPGPAQTGETSVTFRAGDKDGTNEITVTMTVDPANVPPQIRLDPDGTQRTANAGSLLTFDVVADQVPADAGQDVTLSAADLPEGAVFTPNPVTGTPPLTNRFLWIPGFTQTGAVQVMFAAGDVDGTNQLAVDITVLEALPGTPDPAAHYHGYASYYFSPEERTDTNLSASVADSDGDGWLNRMEYVLQWNPRVADTGTPFTAAVESGNVSVVHQALADPPDVASVWQTAGEGGEGWTNATPSGVTTQALPGGMARYTTRLPAGESVGMMRFTVAERDQRIGVPLPGDGTRYDSYAEFDGPRWPTNYGEGHVTLWRHGKFAAYSITIDDNNISDVPFWLGVGTNYGWRFTWFIIIHPYVWDIDNDQPGSNQTYFGTPEQIAAIHDAGHDVQLHGSCAAMNTLTAEAYEDHLLQSASFLADLLDAPVTTYAYPCGDLQSEDGLHDYRAVVARHMIAARGTGGAVTPIHLADYLNTGSLGVNALVDGEPSDLFARVDDGTRPFLYSQYRGWCVTLYHGMSSETTRSNALATFDYVKANEDRFWVAPFTEVAKYAQQRETSDLAIDTVTSNRIAFTLTDGMSDVLFDHPLTVKLRLDPSWTGIEAVQNGTTIPATILLHESNTYATVDAIPDRGQVVITRPDPP